MGTQPPTTRLSFVGQRALAAGLAVAAVGLLLAISPLTAAAPAATTVGEVSPTPSDCGTNAGLVQSSAGAPPTYTVPFDGVLTSFTSWGIGPGSQAKLLALRPPSGTLYNVAAKSEYGTFPDAGLETFPIQVPAQAGQLIAVYGAVCLFFTANEADDVSVYMGAEPPQGSDAGFSPVGGGAGTRVVLSATLESDCDSDGLGDETQDPSVLGGGCPPKGRTLTLDSNKSKVKKGKKVLLSGHLEAADNEQACESGQPVDLQRKRPSQTTFTTVEQLQADAAGNFFAKKKVKKTFDYRAQVPETATCAGGVSNAEKVKVKKPK
jgi:hypothetical protein